MPRTRRQEKLAAVPEPLRQEVRVIAIAIIAIVANVLPAADPSPAPTPFAVRGTLPWHNFLSGPTAWNEEDYAAYFDRLKALDLNLAAFHCYTGGAERYAPYVEPLIRIGYRDVVPEAGFDTSLTARWGYRPLAVEDFPPAAAEVFRRAGEAGAFGARCAVRAATKEERYREAHALFRRAVELAHARGIAVALGFEFGIHPPELASIVPPDSRIPGAMLPDPTHESSIEILRSAIDDIVLSYPGLDWIWLWLHEHTMYIGKARPGARFAEALRRDGHFFEDAGGEEATFTGVWSLCYLREAVRYLKERAPEIRVAIGGWGGGPQLPGLLRGLDRALPADVVFTCLTSGGGWSGDGPLAPLAGHRPVFAIPWLEEDGALWHLQPRVGLLRDQVLQAARQKLAGVVAIHWRTEEIATNLDAFARFARDPAGAPDVEAFYREDAARRYGPEAGAELGPLLAEAERGGWLAGIASPEFFPWEPGWGRMEGWRRDRVIDIQRRAEILRSRSAGQFAANLEWLRSKLRFTVLLDRCGERLEPAYALKARFIRGEVDRAKVRQEAAEYHQRYARDARVEDVVRTFAGSVRSRGELGELSAICQKLWLAKKELDAFFTELEKGPDPAPTGAATGR